MRRKLMIVFMFSSILTFGQKELTRNAVFFFKAFDTLHGKLQTDKIYFLKNNTVDTVKSKVYLDSLIDCLKKNSKIVVEIFLSKNSEWGSAYQQSTVGVKQVRNFAGYICKIRGIPEERIMVMSIRCGPYLVTEEDLKNTEDLKNDNKLRTNFRIIRKDYIPN